MTRFIKEDTCITSLFRKTEFFIKRRGPSKKRNFGKFSKHKADRMRLVTKSYQNTFSGEAMRGRAGAETRKGREGVLLETSQPPDRPVSLLYNQNSKTGNKQF